MKPKILSRDDPAVDNFIRELSEAPPFPGGVPGIMWMADEGCFRYLMPVSENLRYLSHCCFCVRKIQHQGHGAAFTKESYQLGNPSDYYVLCANCAVALYEEAQGHGLKPAKN